jgi:hypothetical protein
VRGGKGNFGIVTSVMVDLLPIDQIYGGGLFFAGERARDVLTAWLAWTQDLDDRLSTSVVLLAAPGPEDVIVHVRIAGPGLPGTASAWWPHCAH